MLGCAIAPEQDIDRKPVLHGGPADPIKAGIVRRAVCPGRVSPGQSGMPRVLIGAQFANSASHNPRIHSVGRRTKQGR